MQSVALTALSFGAAVYAQQPGTVEAENHPSLTVYECTDSGCTASEQSIVIDANWRWLRQVGDGYNNCYTGDEWDTSICSSGEACAENCALEGADYEGTYGITTSSDSVTLDYVTGSNTGSRVYLMSPDDTTYQMFNLKNKEFTFTVDVSSLGCGINGALYFSEMDEDGGLSRFEGNDAGAEYGTGYCDAQCAQDIKFINGLGNVEGWESVGDDGNSGNGNLGACCAEMDIWEANREANAYTPHVCEDEGQVACTTPTECGRPDRYNGFCDRDGCDFNPYRQGNQSFYGEGGIVDTTQPLTVVTQFITSDGTDSGDLVEIRRVYVQDGVVIQNAESNLEGLDNYDSITDQFCEEQKELFEDTPSFLPRGGMSAMGDAFERGMVLVMSIWDDFEAQMLWLDSDYPLDRDPSEPGVSRGPCSTDSGDPLETRSQFSDASVTFSNIRTGPIGSTYDN